MSAENDIHAETESEDGGVPLAKVQSDEMDIDAGSDTTPTSQGSGESSSSINDAWGETLPSPLDEFSEHGDHTAGYHPTPIFLHEVFHSSATPPFSIPQASLSTTSPPTSEALHTLGTSFTVDDAGYGTLDQVQDPHSIDDHPSTEWADQSNWPAINLALPIEIQPHDSLSTESSSTNSDMPQASADPLPTAADGTTPIDHAEPPVGTSEDETAQDPSQNLLEDHFTSIGIDHSDGSDEDWLALPEDSYNLFDSDIAHLNGTLHTLSQASNMVSYYDQDDFEDNSHNFSVSFFLYYWKQMYMSRKPDYPRISQLANERAKVKRPDKITANDREDRDYQGIHWSWYQTTRQEAREVRTMTYRNLRNLGPSEENFSTKAFKAKFEGAVIPRSDRYFRFIEMDMRRRPGFSHFQLRHNLSATSKNAIFYANRSLRHDYASQHRTIMCFNPETGTEECAMDVKKRYKRDDPQITKIHALTAGNGILVAGSYEGLYAMKSLSADFESAPVIGTIATGGDVSTNHIHTHLDRQSGLPRVVFDSNDSSVRILDCYTSKWVGCYKYPYQVNCSVTSPDGRLRLINGDDCEPIVSNAETGETLARLPGHKDFGFACDWAPDGITMATGHQDGLVKVWDARKLDDSIHTIAMEQAGCRSLLFSPLGSGKRVLVLAEPADFVHIVDGQTFESKQTIDFFGEISGISMPPDGSKLYIANADANYGGLMEFERSQDSITYDRWPFGDPHLEDEHEEMVDCIVDGAQPARRSPKVGDKFHQHVEPFMHRQGLPFVVQPVFEERMRSFLEEEKIVIDCELLFFRCLEMGGGQRITVLEEWPKVARTFGIPWEEAVSFGKRLYEYWQDNLAPYETSLPFVHMMQEWRRATRREAVSMDVYENRALKQPTFVRYGKERQYHRDYDDPRRKDFKVGRGAVSLDWLPESDMEHDPRAVLRNGKRWYQRTSKPAVDDDGSLAWMNI